MNTPLDNHRLESPDADRLIDRLVDGELADADRRALLVRLDTEPDGWRRCALAFLESQSWRAALGQLGSDSDAQSLQPGTRSAPARQADRWRRAAWFTVLAASIAVAFVLGWSAHGTPVQRESHAPSVAESPRVPATVPDEVAASQARPGTPAEPPDALEPLVKRLEQRGYRTESQKRSVSVALKDGRKLDVPVHEVRVQYVGGRTY
jgi:hypothetical protein